MFKTTLTVLVVLAMAGAASADVFNMPGGLTSLETVHVGNPGNQADPETGRGRVDYEYDIGTYEVTNAQYREFLNAVAATDTYGLYHGGMDSSQYGCQITQHGTSGSYTYDFAGRPSGTEADWVNLPVNFISWGDAARFANWLHNGQPTGAQGLSTTEDGSYYLNGATAKAQLMTVMRKADATWAIPSEAEWYKAAYHKNDGATASYFDYPTSSNAAPSNDLIDPDPGNNGTFYDGGFTVGSPYWTTAVGEHENSESPYDTFDMGGNEAEWTEAIVTVGEHRGMRGGSLSNYSSVQRVSVRGSYRSPTSGDNDTGFRVVQVPEPATMLLVALGGLAVLRRRS